MGSLFSSPSKQATAAAQSAQGIADQNISNIEGYVDKTSGQLRTGISEQGPNPYFGAAQQLNPQAYYTDPKNTVTFSNQGPGVTSGNPLATPTQAQAPPLPPVILRPQANGQLPGAPPPTAQPPPGQPGQPIAGPGDGSGGQYGGQGNAIVNPIINPITGKPIGGGALRQMM